MLITPSSCVDWRKGVLTSIVGVVTPDTIADVMVRSEDTWRENTKVEHQQSFVYSWL